MMSSMVSRHGRQLQRYSKSGRRLVVGCIPYKFDLGDDADESSVQVLVISSSKGNGFMFPKGGWESDETIKQAVSREAMEEAGVRGNIEGRIGTWVYKSRTYEAHYQAIMFPMKVTEELAQWSEMHQRQRAWVSIAEAKERCHHWWMVEALDTMVKMISMSISIRNDSTYSSSSLKGTTALSFP